MTNTICRQQTLTILLNERAGTFHAAPGKEQVERILDEIGLDAVVISTQSAEEMERILRERVAAGAEKVAVSGGDGTVAAAVQILAHTETALGIIPQGSANNFATALRLPQDLPSALRVLQDGVVRLVDLGEVRGRYFTEAAGVGLFADMLAVYNKGGKSFFRGLYHGLRILLSMRARRLWVTIDEQRIQERAILCTAANSYRMAAFLPIAPGAKVTDGELDIVIIGDLRLHELLSYYRAAMAQMHLNLPKVRTLRGKEVSITTTRPANVHCDDRVVGTTPVTIRSQPGALRVLVDRL
jgi:diacylglycerol kinase (ATP)